MAAAAPPPPLAWPVACEVGRSCMVQHYVDHGAAGGGARDYRCGPQTYGRHDGTDIRLPDMARQRAGVAVLAAAPGVVSGMRDGVADRSTREAGAPPVAGRECGNGVMLQHAGGWSTQYCHLARGSVTVRPGQTVAAGAALGRVGLSGETEFPHLHFTVRHGAAVVDPFAPELAPAACAASGPARTLWGRSAAPYRDPQVLNAGFAPGPVTMEQVEAGEIATPTGGAPALVAYVRAIGLQAGDVQTLTLAAPDGTPLAASTTPPLDRNKAQWLTFAGRRLKTAAWPPGRYRLRYEVKRAGKVVLAEERTANL